MLCLGPPIVSVAERIVSLLAHALRLGPPIVSIAERIVSLLAHVVPFDTHLGEQCLHGPQIDLHAVESGLEIGVAVMGRAVHRVAKTCLVDTGFRRHVMNARACPAFKLLL